MTTLSRSLLLLLIAFTSFHILGAQDKPDDPSKLLNWTTYDEMVSAIMACPEWSATAPTTPEHWSQLLRTAALLQDYSQRDVEIALAGYMLVEQHEHPGVFREQAWSKPMLLLRLMFDIPLDGREAARTLQLRPGGGIDMQLPANESRFPSVSLPIDFTNEMPQCVASPLYQSGASLASPYQPHIEYRAMCQRYKARDLSRFRAVPEADDMLPIPTEDPTS